MRKSLIGVAISLVLLSCNNAKKDEVEKTADATTAETAAAGPDKKAALEVLDMSTADGIKQSFEAFTRGDVDAMAANFADTILYQWSSLDSLRGKQAVVDYYKGRWKVIDSATVSETIVLPIQANESQSKYAPTGKWVLYWGLWHVKYKNGNKISFWMHNVNHFNDAGKVDYIGQYLDRAQVLKAAKSM